MIDLPKKEVDVLVIGSGAAGAISAWDSAVKGLDVSMIGVGTPATEMSSGCIRFNDDRSVPEGLGLDRGDLEDAFSRAERFLIDEMKTSGLKMEGARRDQGRYYRCHGTIVPENIVQGPTSSGGLDRIEGERICVIGFEDRTEFDHRLFAKALAQRSDLRVEHIAVGTTNGVLRNSSVDDLLDMFVDAAGSASGEVVFVPPFISLKDIDRWEELEKRSGRKFAEPVMDLGMPGARLRDALISSASRAGVSITNGASIVGMSISKGSLNEVTVRSGHRLQHIECGAAVFCGGGLVGGGLGVSGKDVIDPLGLFDVRYLREGDGIDILARASSGGIRTGPGLEAIVDGEKVRNLFVAGASLPGMNIVEGNGIGDAMATALLASKAATEASR
ncbi:MAG: FAD-binding protein [Euryarchaeota archaeon]|nr:FAD-binding protein [Euryarchaeota archaeon]